MPVCEMSRSELSGLEIMVVDDEIGIRELLAEHLNGLGLVVTTVPDGQAAIAALEDSNGRFTMVLTDINMPGADGFEVLKAARCANAAAKVVVLTGYSSQDSALKALRLGAHDYLEKPFKLNQIDTILERSGERSGHAQLLRCAQAGIVGSPTLN